MWPGTAQHPARGWESGPGQHSASQAWAAARGAAQPQCKGQGAGGGPGRAGRLGPPPLSCLVSLKSHRGSLWIPSHLSVHTACCKQASLTLRAGPGGSCAQLRLTPLLPTLQPRPPCHRPAGSSAATLRPRPTSRTSTCTRAQRSCAPMAPRWRPPWAKRSGTWTTCPAPCPS